MMKEEDKQMYLNMINGDDEMRLLAMTILNSKFPSRVIKRTIPLVDGTYIVDWDRDVIYFNVRGKCYYWSHTEKKFKINKLVNLRNFPGIIKRIRL